MTTDKDRFEQIYSDHYELLCRCAYKILGDHEACRDIVQEVFITIWNNRNKWNQIKSFKPYLLSSVYNRSIDSYHQQKKTIQLQKTHYELPADRDHKDPEYIELELQVSKAITQLPEKCRQIFLLKREEDLTYKEIAEQLGISVKTVENQMGIALKKIKEHLDTHWRGEKTFSVFLLGGVLILSVY
jgi:RNA polymerase sigma-70 factor, ECF subfamily